MPQYANGWQAAKADGWCIQCMKQAHQADKSMCAVCEDKRNVRSRNRTERQPATVNRPRRHWQAEIGEAFAR